MTAILYPKESAFNKIFFSFANYDISTALEEELLQRTTLSPNVCFGKPTIRNMRYPVEIILADYEDLEEADLQTCPAFAQK